MQASPRFAAVFPGQGSQSLNMLGALAQTNPIIKATFADASDALGLDLWALCQNGPESELNRTENTQPALLTASVAVYSLWSKRSGNVPAIMAGHSLGEYSAYVCAGAMQLQDAVRLVRLRGQLMQNAVPDGVGAMAAILNGEDELITRICAQVAENEIVAPANFNSPGQVVISGHKTAVERALLALKAAGVKRAIVLPVSVPSHCALMRTIEPVFADALAKTPIQTPAIPVVANVNATAHTDPTRIRECLLEQLWSPVRWVDSVRALHAHRIGEFGPGRVLSGLIKRIDPAIDVRSLEEPATFELALTEWN